jgi:hypothetical protein
MGQTKKCSKCKEFKELTHFYKNRHKSDGLQDRCRVCHKEYLNKWRAENPEKRKQQNARRNHRVNNLRNLYGLSPEDFELMARTQNGLCAICQSLPDQLVVDHCHITGNVRGLLCNKCNRGIGQLNDDIETVRSALEYLERAK